MTFSQINEVETILAEVRVEMGQQGMVSSLTSCKFEQVEVENEKITKRIVGENLSDNWEIIFEVYQDCKTIKGKFRSTTLESNRKPIRQYFDTMHMMYPQVRTMGWNNNNKHHQYLEKKIDIRGNRTQAIIALVQEAKYILDNVL